MDGHEWTRHEAGACGPDCPTCYCERIGKTLDSLFDDHGVTCDAVVAAHQASIRSGQDFLEVLTRWRNRLKLEARHEKQAGH